MPPWTWCGLPANAPRPGLGGDGHGSWHIQLELPAALDGGRRRIRRGYYPSRGVAVEMLAG